jgi:hypothetical protein
MGNAGSSFAGGNEFVELCTQAIEYSDVEAVARILEDHGPKVIAFREKESGASVLHHAVGLDAGDTIQALVAGGFTVNVTDAHMNTPLHFAAQCDSRAAIPPLLRHGADLSCRNDKGQTALHVAIEFGNADAAKLIIASATSQEQLDIRDDAGRTPAELAKFRNYPLLTAVFQDHLWITAKRAEGMVTYGVTASDIALDDPLKPFTHQLFEQSMQKAARLVNAGKQEMAVRLLTDLIGKLDSDSDMALPKEELTYLKIEVLVYVGWILTEIHQEEAGHAHFTQATKIMQVDICVPGILYLQAVARARIAGCSIGNVAERERLDCVVDVHGVEEALQVLRVAEHLSTSVLRAKDRSYSPELLSVLPPIQTLRSKIQAAIAELKQHQVRLAQPPPTLYDALRLDRDAAVDDIRIAYKTLSRVFHPDKFPFASTKHHEKISNEFRLIKKAYDVLMDPTRKAFYDSLLDSAHTDNVKLAAVQTFVEGISDAT